jgi:hypothetical protein
LKNKKALQRLSGNGEEIGTEDFFGNSVNDNYFLEL